MIVTTQKWLITKDSKTLENDFLAIEEPLEIVLSYSDSGKRLAKSISITMRTPSHDFDLALGFLFSEGIIHAYQDVLSVRFIHGVVEKDAPSNIVQIDLHPNLKFDFNQLNRHFYTSSSCGVCGKSAIELLQNVCPKWSIKADLTINKAILFDLPEKMRQAQATFEHTGGLHAAALFDAEGNLTLLREDVGRHNALDKVLGFALKKAMLPLQQSILLLSGRLSFELLQKASMAAIPIVVAIGAPSSLALQLAQENGITLIGFLKNHRFNVYCGEERIV